MYVLKKIIKSVDRSAAVRAVACALVLMLTCSICGFDSKCGAIRENVLRLHILANSDSEEDQFIKLEIRDKLLTASNGLFESAGNKEQAIKTVNDNTDVFINAAQSVLKEYGKNQSVSIDVGRAYFDTREYENFTLPAGEYDAVRVLIGKAEGKNWWCVMFPSMCIPAAEKEHKLTEAVDPLSAEIAENAPRYEMRFKIVEWYEKVKMLLK